MIRLGLIAAACAIAASPACTGEAGEMQISVDTEYAQTLMSLACSGEEIDEAAFRASPLLQAQLRHHGAFGERFSMENFLAGLNATAACQTLEEDPFRFAALVKRRDELDAALAFLEAHEDDIASKITDLLAPYTPDDFAFSGSVVIAAASFSCGGFAEGEDFFIDLQCIAGDIEDELGAIQYLSAHETYHAIQNRFVPPPVRSDIANVETAGEAREHLFRSLVTEGGASHVADFRDVVGDGAYAKFSRDGALRNYRRLADSFKLLDYLVEAVGHGEDIAVRTQDAYDLGFGGRFDELFYYVGAQIAAEIDHDFGPDALTCIFGLPAENMILAYEKAYDEADRLADSHPLRQTTYDAARGLAESREPAADLSTCL